MSEENKKIPMNLKHKPVIIVEDYEQIDGRNAGNSDAKGLSLGLAQWNDRGLLDISAKVWRYTGQKWSRQSEELPMNRVIDLAILICKAKQYLAESYRFPKLYDENDPQIDRVGLQGSAMTVKIAEENPMIDGDIKLFAEVFSRDDELMSERLHLLANLLNEMGYGYGVKR
ncbi:MAG: DUF6530 family protein [Oscillospiraceae bacterium]